MKGEQKREELRAEEKNKRLQSEVCECVMAAFTAAVVAESLFGRNTTGICLWSLSSARQKPCLCVSTL